MATPVTSVQSAALDVHDTLAAIWCLFLPMLIAPPAAAVNSTSHIVASFISYC